MRKKDITGKRFGKLIAIRPTDQRDTIGGVIWELKCDCGNVVKSPLSSIKAGHIKSCGCNNIKNLAGKRFGKLLVLEITNHRAKNGSIQWECQCDCGKKIIVSSNSLVSGHAKSCGCIKRKNAKKLANKYANKIFKEQQESVLKEGTNLDLIAKKQPNKNSTTGIRGVSYNKSTNMWLAQMQFKRQTVLAKWFKTKSEAAQARAEAEKKYCDPILEKYNH